MKQIDPIGAGARPAFNGADFGEGRGGHAVSGAAVAARCHSMPVMRDEIFGPVAGIMKVASDEAAVTLMNDSVRTDGGDLDRR